MASGSGNQITCIYRYLDVYLLACTVSRYLTDWPGLCAVLITVLSLLLVILTFPLSLLVTVKVVISHQ